MSELLPQHPGLLPYFLLFTSFLAFIHAAVCYLAPAATTLTQFRGPLAPPPHDLTARLFGVRDVYTALIRTYTAYHITNPQLYTLAMLAYVGAFGLYATEVFYYKTIRVRQAITTFVMTTSAIIWMVSQRGYYTGAGTI